MRASIRASVEPPRGARSVRWSRRWWSATTRARPGARRRLPHHRADPPAGRLRHQPDPGRRLPAGRRRGGAGCAGAGSYAVGGPRHRRVRAAGPDRAERGAGGGDGVRRPCSRWARNGRAARHRAPGRRRGRCCCSWTRDWPCSVGFALSVLATGGILLLAPAWRDAMARWLPRWVAEAVSVPLAAQLACTPVVAAISGQVSLVAVLANLLVAPAVGPATVLGLAGGLVGLVWAPLGRAGRRAWRRGACRGSWWSPGVARPCRRRQSTGGPAPVALVAAHRAVRRPGRLPRRGSCARPPTGVGCSVLRGGHRC